MARKGFLVGFKPLTRASYADGLKQWFEWCAMCGIDPLEAQRAHIELWGRFLEEERQLNPSTVAHRLVTLRSFYNYCEDEGIVTRSPAARVRLPKFGNDSSTHGMTNAETVRFVVASQRNPLQHALVCMLLLNGMRISEACGTNIEDLGNEGGHRTIRIHRKGGKYQTLPLSPKTCRAVDAVIGTRTEGPILLTRVGTRMTRYNAAEIIARIGKRAGLSYHVHPHMLRHAFCTISLDSGAPLHHVQDSMGHADPRSTMRYNRNRNSLDNNSTHLVSSMISFAS